MVGTIIDYLVQLRDALLEFKDLVIDYLNPYSSNFFLKIAFVPDGDSLDSGFAGIYDVFSEKFAFYLDFKDFLSSVTTAVQSPEPPVFNVTLPGGIWGDGMYTVIDFSYYIQYRPYILDFTRFIAWFFFVKSVYRRTPRIIAG
jgi:hypothetical protein